MSFIEMLKKRWNEGNTLVCVGLDPDPKRIPDCIPEGAGQIFEFNKRIIDATAEFVAVYKPQFAHYGGIGREDELLQSIRYIKENYPDIPVILDSKRGDIGSTAQKYALEAFERYGADAVTVNPYLGLDSISPFTEYGDKGVVILCRTSNPSAPEFQDLEVEGRKLFLHVAERVAKEWNGNGNCLLVTGATYPEELGEIRKAVGDLPFLVPGIGAQGGDVKAVLKNGVDSNGAGLIISSSRGIIYAGDGDDFAEAAGVAAKELRDTINNFR